jgi:hypothetical protein
MAGDDKAGGTCFVADFEFLELDFKFFRELLKSLGHGGDVPATLTVVGCVLATSCKGVGDGNCFLVDIESDVVGLRRGVFRY